METSKRKRIAICESQPVTAEGLRSIVEQSGDLEWLGTVTGLDQAHDLVWLERPDALIVDKAFGMHSVLEALPSLRGRDESTAIVTWGVSLSQAEALRLLQSGVKGIVRKAASAELILACLRSVLAGVTWVEEVIFQNAGRPAMPRRGELTPRERQVLDLIEQGFRNKDIARELGIRPGTAKIHLKHIFEKTGVRGRYGLALSGMRERGAFASV